MSAALFLLTIQLSLLAFIHMSKWYLVDTRLLLIEGVAKLRTNAAFIYATNFSSSMQVPTAQSRSAKPSPKQ